LFCGKEIGPFRLLRDREFCCSAHRSGYSARLGKVLGAISADEPPPAPLATFIPYKPFPGKNLTPSQFCTLEHSRYDLQIPATWNLSIVPLGRERAVPLTSVKPSPLPAGDFTRQTQPQAWSKSSSLQQVEMTLEPDEWDFEIEDEVDPLAAGPVTVDLPAAEWKKGAQSNPEPYWTSAPVQLPRPAALGRTLGVCGGFVGGLLAQTVEAFLPPGPDPQELEYSVPPAAFPRWTARAADWVVLAELAGPAPGLTAQAVESYLPALPEPRVIAWPITASLPGFSMAAVDWLIAAPMADPVATPEAQPVEAFLPSFAEPQIAAWATIVAKPTMALAAADLLIAAEMADPVAAPEAQPVEAFLPAFAEPQIAGWTTILAKPTMALAAADLLIAAETADPVAAPAPQPVEAFLPAFAEPVTLPWPALSAALPKLAVDPIAWSLSVDLAGAVSAPAAQPVESWLAAACEAQATVWPTVAAILPSLAIAAADWILEATIAEPVEAPAAQPVEAFLPMAVALAALPATTALRLPDFAFAAIAPEIPQEFVPPVVIADICQNWMPSPAACEAVCDVIPSVASEWIAALHVSAPATALSLTLPAVRWEGDWRPSLKADPVISFVRPHLEAALPISFPIPALDTRVVQRTLRHQKVTLSAPAAAQYPMAVDQPSAAASSEVQVSAGPAIVQFPALAVQKTAGNQAAPFQGGVPPVAQPAGAEPNQGAAIELDPATVVQSPALPAAVLHCKLDLAEIRNSGFVFQRERMEVTKTLAPIEAGRVVFAPKFVVRPIFERLEEPAAPRKPVEKTPAFAEIFTISKVARQRNWTSHAPLFSAGKLIAASLLVGIGMWFGFGSVKISRQMLAIDTSLHGIGSGSSIDSVSPSVAPSLPSPRYSAPKSPTGPIASVRHAIQSRAAVELTDTFKRMEAWGSSALPTGWTRNSDGYVRTGQLALFRPAQNFSDYRFEFFGEIEKKGMSWAVRAHDPQNYYGMKMAVIEPGLRPVVAVVHYAVVAGKKMQRSSTPLSIMVHNNEPYHVAIEVKGNKVTTSIEGEEVDSWTDDALKVGGVGFFSEVGESARLYWMRVSKNQDWLGRVCAYLASGSNNNTADLWTGDMPGDPSMPQPTLPPAADTQLAAAEDYEDFSHSSSQRARILKDGRTELCRS
jgi:hypothetical protein